MAVIEATALVNRSSHKRFGSSMQRECSWNLRVRKQSICLYNALSRQMNSTSPVIRLTRSYASYGSRARIRSFSTENAATAISMPPIALVRHGTIKE